MIGVARSLTVSVTEHRHMLNAPSYIELAIMHLQQVGAVYGRKTMCGLLASEGTRVAETRVGESLKRVAPTLHQRRQQNTGNHWKGWLLHFIKEGSKTLPVRLLWSQTSHRPAGYVRSYPCVCN